MNCLGLASGYLVTEIEWLNEGKSFFFSLIQNKFWDLDLCGGFFMSSVSQEPLLFLLNHPLYKLLCNHKMAITTSAITEKKEEVGRLSLREHIQKLPPETSAYISLREVSHVSIPMCKRVKNVLFQLNKIRAL